MCPLSAGRPAARLPGGRENAPPAGPFARLHGVEPVQPRLMEQLDEAGRDMNVRMPVTRAGFEHAHVRAGVLAQPIGEDAARGPRADDHIVKGLHDLAAYSAAATAVGSV